MRNIKETQDKQGRCMLNIEKTAHDVTAGHALARALLLRMTTMSKRIADLEAQNRALKVKPVVHPVNRQTAGHIA
jgi:hypothetical protein